MTFGANHSATGCAKPLDHAVVVVGYGDEPAPDGGRPTPFWLVKNSWGAQWGEGGYFKLARGPAGVGGKGAAGLLSIPGFPVKKGARAGAARAGGCGALAAA